MKNFIFDKKRILATIATITIGGTCGVYARTNNFENYFEDLNLNDDSFNLIIRYIDGISSMWSIYTVDDGNYLTLVQSSQLDEMLSDSKRKYYN